MAKTFKILSLIIIFIIFFKVAAPYFMIFALSYWGASHADTPEQKEIIDNFNPLNLTMTAYRENCVNRTNETWVNEIIEKRCLFFSVTLAKTAEVGLTLGAKD